MMRDYSVFFILCLMMIGLSARVTKAVSVQHAYDRALCTASCEEHLKICSQVCHKSRQECSNTANSGAAQHYQRWVHEQVVQGGILSRELNSYRDPLQCRKTTCNCQADYTVCNAPCTGIIRKRLQVGPACC